MVGVTSPLPLRRKSRPIWIQSALEIDFHPYGWAAGPLITQNPRRALSPDFAKLRRTTQVTACWTKTNLRVLPVVLVGLGVCGEWWRRFRGSVLGAATWGQPNWRRGIRRKIPELDSSCSYSTFLAMTDEDWARTTLDHTGSNPSMPEFTVWLGEVGHATQSWI
jgi:hypothetical protein